VVGVQFLAEAEVFSLHHCIQMDSRAHPASCPLGTIVTFLGVKLLGHEVHCSPLFYLALRLRMCGALPPLPNMFSWCGAYLSTEYIFMKIYLVKHWDISAFTYN
jgi:hypothetical protein